MDKGLQHFFPDDPPIAILHGYPLDDPKFPYPTGREKNPLNAGRLVGLVDPKDPIKVIVFDETLPGIAVLRELAFPQAEDRQQIVVPLHDEGMQVALLQECAPRSVVQAQRVLTQSRIDHLLAHKSEDLDYLQDKTHLRDLLDPRLLPEILYTFENGNIFSQTEIDSKNLPCVVKVARSAGGNGVHICHTQDDIQTAKERFKDFDGNIFIEKFIEGEPVAILYGIRPSGEIVLISDNMQISNERGNNMGGIVNLDIQIPANIRKMLEESILKKMVEMGWFGVCSFGGIVTPDAKFYFFDPNIRTSGSLNHGMQRLNGVYPYNLATFLAKFHGTRKRIQSALMSVAQYKSPQQIIHIASLATVHRQADLWYMHGAVQFNDPLSLHQNTERFKSIMGEFGLESYALDRYLVERE